MIYSFTSRRSPPLELFALTYNGAPLTVHGHRVELLTIDAAKAEIQRLAKLVNTDPGCFGVERAAL